MAISQDGYDFEAPTVIGELHQEIPAAPVQVHNPPGIVGESHTLSPLRGRLLTIRDITLEFGTPNAMLAGLHRLALATKQLTGTLTIGSAQYRECTFDGFEEFDRFYDPASGNSVVYGSLRWRQRKLTASSTP